MRTSTVVVGLLFGAIFGVTLVPPLFVALPRRFVDSWYYISPETTLVALIAALLVVALAGFIAAALEPDEAVRTGTVAGTLAVAVGGTLVALPAAEIEACGALLSMTIQQSTSVDELRALTVETLVDGVWIPAASALVLLAGGPALGAMGGVIYDLWRGSTSRTTRTIHRSWIPIVAMWALLFAVFLSTAWAVHLDLTVLPRLEAPMTWADRMSATSPLFVASVVQALLLAWGVRDAVLVYRDQRRISGLFWLMMIVAPAFTAFCVVATLHPASLVTPGPWVFAGAGVVTTLAAGLSAARSEVTFEPQPRSLGEVIGEALLAGTLVTGIIAFVAFDGIVGSYTIGFPYVRGLLAGAAVVDAPPDQLVTRVFALHAVAVVAVFAFAAAYLGIAGPLWLVGRLARR